MREYLVIEGVDLDLLEEQRLELCNLGNDTYEYMSSDQRQAFMGVLNMLEGWSDKRRILSIQNFIANHAMWAKELPSAAIVGKESIPKEDYLFILDERFIAGVERAIQLSKGDNYDN